MAEKSFWGEKKDKKWFANLWYYYKKVFLAAAVVIAFVVYGCVSCLKTVDYDLEMYYFGNTRLMTKVFDNTAKYFENVVDDVDGKNGTQVYCLDLTSVDSADAATEMDYAMQSKIQIEIAEGEGYLYIMTQKWADYCKESELLEDISKYTGDSTAVYAVDITDNPIMKSLGFETGEKLYAGVRVLNSNRVGKEKYEKKHSNAIKAMQHICGKNNFQK